MTTSKSTHHIARKIVIKLGGSTLEGLNPAFFQKILALRQEGYKVIITHGGGPAINRTLAANNVASHVINGIRVTTAEAIDLVKTTLIGQVNPFLVQQLNAAGIQAVGLNGFDGHLLASTFLDEATYGYVGHIEKVNTELLDALLTANIVPVIACIGTTADGQALNINGDTVASEVALATEAESLLLVTDVSGIRIEGEYQSEVTEVAINEWIAEGHIYGGMIPKVQGALACLAAGIPAVQIVDDTLDGTKISARHTHNSHTI
ncbi:acetylglutamate kinase [Metasolibacillus sp.]|uniref:acetylglutamate kinase n=1 Tax=Metasolibacillus sp. TaxID=2703680 RepID=UPI0025EE8D94|nr:acetylglutamate kinase [Metasolibacillus sp.]MCT6925843.1 acetylglutamate kinase [Metasolibacillus sp.]MCT6942000.1 acetylglutamate kinase [Metasolibacillus sp.]